MYHESKRTCVADVHGASTSNVNSVSNRFREIVIQSAHAEMPEIFLGAANPKGHDDVTGMNGCEIKRHR